VYRREFLLHFTKLPPTPLEQLEQLEQLRALEHGYRIKVGTTRYTSVEVNTPDDLARVKRLMQTPQPSRSPVQDQGESRELSKYPNAERIDL
jgi:CMP-2-keto-3-deoxyoctulosonic acid synthetase